MTSTKIGLATLECGGDDFAFVLGSTFSIVDAPQAQQLDFISRLNTSIPTQ